MPPPPGKVSNFDHPENRDQEIIVVNAVFLTLMILAVAMRFFVRRTADSKVGWDGLMCIIAALASIAHSGLMISSLSIGYGRHLWDIRAITLTQEKALRMNQISMTYVIAVGFAKLYVLLLYLRFFKVIRFTAILIWFGIVFNILFFLAFLGVVIGQALKCIGLGALTNPFCGNVNKATAIQAAINVFLDFYILFIPLQQVYSLKVTTRKKLGVAAVFGVGSLACFVSVVRLGWSVKNLHESDHFWSAILTSEMSAAEINIVIIAPCLIFMPAFIKASKTGLSTLRTRLLSSRSGSKGSINRTASQDAIVDTPGDNDREIRKQQSIELRFVRESSDSTTPSTTVPPQSYHPSKTNISVHHQ
ncbi:hypothetical protein K469DRAFT_631712 [Zopfia rhizophila CBS 207.26]|uniref:Rhodopsin domain-containing protein n=1 Tax=Zopfia rhizophila CBS 207.26 TaxID=1314779 RepID=A0A6A6E3R0_9PEZI|nr:hypothetical protein K469DRAFT_631712 [Zopfia rhizophila CBS 207.26]